MSNFSGKKKNKRISESHDDAYRSRKTGDEEGSMVVDEGEELVFEDPFGDDYEDEDIYENENEQDIEVEEWDDISTPKEGKLTNSNLYEEELNEDVVAKAWRPGIDQLGEDEELEYDPSAYIMYHSLRTEWPCLSFDFLRDDLGDNRHRFPLTIFCTVGSQADRQDKNKISILKLSQLSRIQGGESDEDDEEDEIDEDPCLENVDIPHNGGVNRLKCMPQRPGVIASMSETRHVHIFDATETFQSMLSTGPTLKTPTKPIYSFRGHNTEGFAIDWSNAIAGRLATGDCSGSIHVWNSSGNTWQVDSAPYKGHFGSVEDLQWSPSEATVFMSSSSDNTVKVWDIRGKNGPQISINAHSDDVNVISWNKSVSYLVASGCEDGSFKVWDLRSIRNKTEPLANFNYHTKAISSIEWSPHDESILCLSSADNQVTIWDLSVEADEEDISNRKSLDPNLNDFPPQLLFIHQGQNNVKEIHHHNQIPGVIMTTAEDGLNIFKAAINVT